MAMSFLRAATSTFKKATSKVSGGTMFNAGLGLFFGYGEYASSREQGDGAGVALLKASSETVLSTIMPLPAYLAYQAVTELPGVAVDALESYHKYGRNLESQSIQRPFRNAQFNDSQQVFTMRQAGMALAQKSKYSLQQAMLGNEAQYMHR